MSNGLNFEVYEGAVAALVRLLPGAAFGKESAASYSLSHDIDLTADWQSLISEVVQHLVPASFDCELRFSIQEYAANFKVKLVSGQAMANCHFVSPQPPVLPTDAVATFGDFERMTGENPGVVLSDLLNTIAILRSHESAARLTFKSSLQKSLIAPAVGFQPSGKQKLVYYLFAENFRQSLAGTSLEQFEADFCEVNQRTVILTFDTRGSINGKLLLVCGTEHAAQILALDAQPLTPETSQLITGILALRKAEMLGNFPLKCLTPEFFSVSPAQQDEPAVFTSIRKELSAHQALLATLFMADYVEPSGLGYQVEYRGIRTTKLHSDRGGLLKYVNYFDDLVGLYGFAYDGLQADKLEIVQQFLSLMVSSVEALYTKATEIREAAEKNYAIVMKERVALYFDALEKVEDRIKTALEKAAEDVINLGREVSADVYKVAGLIAAAVAGALLKPDFGWLVALTASLVIAIYLWLVIFYYLETLKETFDLHMMQHTAYIDSFNEILGQTKFQEFQDNRQLKDAKDLFVKKLTKAQEIYTGFLIISLLVAQACIQKLSIR